MAKWKKPQPATARAAKVEPTLSNEAIAAKFALDRFSSKGFGAASKLIVVSDGKVRDLTVQVPAKFGIVGLFAGAHCLLRAGAEEDCVAVVGTIPGIPGQRHRAQAYAVARSRQTAGFDSVYLPRAGGGVDAYNGRVGSEAFATDFDSEDYFIDPKIAAGLSACAFPGAVAPRPEAGDGGPNESPTATPASPHVPPAPAEGQDAHSATSGPWESVNLHRAELRRPVAAELRPAIRFFAARLLPAPSGPLREMLERHASNAAVSVGLGLRMLPLTSDLEATADLLVTWPSLPDEVRAWFAAAATDRATFLATRGVGEPARAFRYAGLLVAIVRRISAGAGGPIPWLDEILRRAVAPNPVRSANPIGDHVRQHCAIVAVAAAVLWRRQLANLPSAAAPTDEPLESESAWDAGLLRQRLTDFVAGTAGQDTTSAHSLGSALALHLGKGPAQSIRGREDALRDALGDKTSTFRDLQNLRSTAIMSAYVLHALTTYADFAARVEGSESGWVFRFELLDDPDLLDSVREPIARQLILNAERNPAEDAAELLARARTLVPTSPMIMACANEGEFRIGNRSRALLDQLRREPTSLGSLAETFEVARTLGDPGRLSLLRRVVQLTEGTPDAWAARVLACFERPGELANSALVAKLVRETPSDLRVDTRRRHVHALYGDDPDGRLAEWRSRLAAQSSILAGADALRIERVEDNLTRPPPPKRERPSVPDAPSAGCVFDALAALRWRLGRPAAARFADRAALFQHAREALALADLEESLSASRTALSAFTLLDAWLAALRGTPESGGLVPALDLAIATEEVEEIAPALQSAAAALVAAKSGARLQNIHHRLLMLELQRLAPEDRAKLQAVRVDALAATSVEDLTAAERALVALEGGLETPPCPPKSNATSADDVDDFRPMRCPRRSISRSRKELDTPEWALDSGVRQVSLYNAARGQRDLKMLNSTRGSGGALWELRLHDARHPVRVTWRHTSKGPVVIAIMVKDDEEDQRRIIERIKEWETPDPDEDEDDEDGQ